MVLFHEAYEYVAHDYGMQVVYVMDLDEERQVSAGEVAEMLTAVRDGQVTAVLAEELTAARWELWWNRRRMPVSTIWIRW